MVVGHKVDLYESSKPKIFDVYVISYKTNKNENRKINLKIMGSNKSMR